MFAYNLETTICGCIDGTLFYSVSVLLRLNADIIDPRIITTTIGSVGLCPSKSQIIVELFKARSYQRFINIAVIQLLTIVFS